MNYCKRMVRDSGQAEDIAQEALVRTLTRLERYDERYSFSAWIFKIATNLCIDHLRKAKRIAFSLDEDIQGGDGSFRREMPGKTAPPSEETLANEQMQLLNEALATLPEHYRAILLLRHREDLSYDEIARVLDLPIGTVKIRIHRAREHIKRSLNRDEVL
ncbi:MAG: sigma-70 family RNA polymerase sigma factor [bacterium]|nr:sigma-70 family RNA polymerase sigma factor [bacterium]